MTSACESGPSAWVQSHAGLVAPGGRILDLAAGGGRHARYFKGLGYKITALDRDVSGLRDLADTGVEILAADLEDGSPWPLGTRAFDGIVVTNYLHRPLLPTLVDALEPGGILVYETFAQGNERFGKPSNPAFLLSPGELIRAFEARLRILAYEDLVVEKPRRAAIQRICARA